MIVLFLLLFFSEWTAFFGRFHPLLVHLPIGFLMLIGIFEVLKAMKKLSLDDQIVKVALFITAISATMACVAGYFLSFEGGYNEEILGEHQNQGIALAVFSWLACLSKNVWLNSKFHFIKFIYFPSLGFATLLMFVAGHHGGNLTHGETYLTENTPQPFRNWLKMPDKESNSNAEKPKITNINEAMVYQEIVHPIFKDKCEKCHNASKMKGDLRMDTIELLQKGGKNGVIFKANNVAESEFIKRILLPESDEHHMPPKGKNQVTENELSLLQWWVEQGASFDKKVSQLIVSESIKPILASLGGASLSTNLGVKQDKFDREEQILNQGVNAIDKNTIDEIKRMGGLVLPMAQNNNYAEISFINNSKLTDNEAIVIAKAPEQILWLKLSNTQITDKILSEIAKLENLTRLHLEKTKITDKGLEQLKVLQNLEYLNLTATQISDAGLQTLSSIKSLKKIYLWKTKVTQQGAEQLKKSLPNLVIDLGISEQQMTVYLKDTTKPKDDVYKK